MYEVLDTVFPFSPQEELRYAQRFTEAFRETQAWPVPLRELHCLQAQFPATHCAPCPGDPFMGRICYPVVMFSPQPGDKSLGYAFSLHRWQALLENASLTDGEKAQLRDLEAFWRQESTQAKVKASYPPDIRHNLRYESFTEDRAVAHPLYRMSGSQLDFGKLLRLGVTGLKQEIDSHRAGADVEALALYDAMDGTLDLFGTICRHYVQWIDENLPTITDTAWAGQLAQTRESLTRIATGPAASFRDAIQMVMLWWFFSGTLNFARMDTYLAEYYVRDVDTGVLSEAEALDLLCEMWRMMVARREIYNTRVLIGGRGRENEAVCDHFCLLAIEATRRVKEGTPQLTLRIYEGMNQQVMDLALTAIGEGRTFPMLLNDDANIPAVQKAFCLPREEAEQYCPFGCGEYVLAHRSLGTPSGIINLAKALEITLNNGRDMETGEQLGLDLGNLTDYQTFDDLFAAYKAQVEFFVPLLARQEALEYSVGAEEASFLALSILYDDCIARGRGATGGGVRYLGGTLEAYGNVNTANSLTALKTLLYDTKAASAQTILEALRANFAGYESLQRQMQSCPKYGNDETLPDDMLLAVHRHICLTTRESVKLTHLHSYLIVVINNDANTSLGRLTWATPDGRGAGVYLANANNPFNGTDTQGLTAMLNSIVKPDIDIHAGSVQNLKLSKAMFTPAMLPCCRAPAPCSRPTSQTAARS